MGTTGLAAHLALALQAKPTNKMPPYRMSVPVRGVHFGGSEILLALFLGFVQEQGWANPTLSRSTPAISNHTFQKSGSTHIGGDVQEREPAAFHNWARSTQHQRSAYSLVW
jgi:hypothetical protein